MINTYFTEEKDEIMRQFWGKKQAKQIVKEYFPDRTVAQLYKRARKLGLKSTLFMSEEQKANNKILRTGSKHSEETRKKISQNSINNWANPEYKAKVLPHMIELGKSWVGVEKGEEQKRKLSEARIGVTWGNHDEEAKRAISKAHKGKIVPEESRKKLSQTRIRLGLASGDKNPAYKNGKSQEPYPMGWKFSLKEKIREMDKKCVMCSKTNEEHKQEFGCALCIHHIDGNKDNLKETNLISMCRFHHLKIQKIQDSLMEHFYSITEERANKQFPSYQKSELNEASPRS